MVVWDVAWWLRTNTDHDVLLCMVIGSVNWPGFYQEHQESYHTTPCCVFCGCCEEVHRGWSRAEDTIWESPSLSLKSRWIFHHVEQPGVRVLSPNAIVSLLLSPLSRRTPRILNVDVWTGWHRIKNFYVCIEPETQTRTRTSILSGDGSDILC